MANPLQKFFPKKAIAGLPARTRRILTGLARDFWKDGKEEPLRRSRSGKDKTDNKSVPVSPAPVLKAGTSVALDWHAMPGEISEKMWGEGLVTPGGDALSDMLITPLSLKKEMNVLDLSAGLGGRMRKTTEEFGVFITGLEPDPGIAERGMEMSVAAGKAKQDVIISYQPTDFVPGKTVTKIYDCILARETFYRVDDKRKFFTALAACTKPQAQLSFTDYILNPEDRAKPGIAAWMTYQNGVAPLSLVEMAEAWAKVGFKLHTHDDQTSFYRKEVLSGLQRFAKFLASGVRPDAETREAVLRRTELWTHRLAAMEEGLKFYRFYGTK